MSEHDDLTRYNLGYVLRETGMQADTLRAWEKRYGVPSPIRSDGGHRLYTHRDIQTVRWLLKQQKEGLSISKAVQLLNTMLERGDDPINPMDTIQSAILLEAPAPDQLRASWIDACRDYDNARANQTLSIAFANYPIKVVLSEIFQKGLYEVGDLWYKNEIRVQQEHFASEVVLRQLHALIASAYAPIRDEKILIVLPAGEEHEVAALMLALLLRYAGWDVIYLGTNVPIEKLEDTLQQIKPSLVILSAQRLTSAASMLDISRLINLYDIPVAFGGEIFNRIPTLKESIPGFFMGEKVEGSVTQVESVLTRKINLPSAQSISDIYKIAHKSFKDYLPAIHSQLRQELARSKIRSDEIEMYSRYFSENILAALTLGNMEYATPEISWFFELIKNHRGKENQLQEVLIAYQRAVEMQHVDELLPIGTWLSGLKF